MIAAAQTVTAISAMPDTPSTGTSQRVGYQWIGGPGIIDSEAKTVSPTAALAGRIRPPYTPAVAETTAAGRGNPWTIGGRAAAHAAIFSSARFCTSVFYGGPGEGQLRLGRFPMGRFSTPCRRARHPSCGNERRASNLTIGGRYMRHIPARPEQALSTVQRHPLFARAGTEAAALWLKFAPLTAAEFRDMRFRNMVTGLGYLSDFGPCRDAFNDAFAAHIATAIATLSGAEVRA